MVVLGAILALGVRAEAPGIDIQTIGVILMLGGVAVLAHARRGTRREHVVTRIEDPLDPEQPVHPVREHVTDREIP
jgi:hypothetical protein